MDLRTADIRQIGHRSHTAVRMTIAVVAIAKKWWRRPLVLWVCALICCIAATGGLAGRAVAADQFTLDPGADSMGPVAIDSSGNAYVSWLHDDAPGQTVMFCKLAPGARGCADPITLPVALDFSAATPNTPFPVLGPGNTVFVVAPSYDSSQIVIWESTDGGASFGAPYVSPTALQLANPNLLDECDVAVDLDDVLAFNAYGGEYDRSQGSGSLGSGGVSLLEFEMSSADPDATWSFAFYGENPLVANGPGGCAYAIPPAGSPPPQYFQFGGGDSGTEQTTLGWAPGGSAACTFVDAGDEVEAYSAQDGASNTVQFYEWSAPTGACAETGVNLSPSSPHNWAGPYTVTQGALPRLAGGHAGLFLLSGDAVNPGTTQPTAVDVRRYDVATHSFGPPLRLAVVHDEDFSLGGPAGGLGESDTTGELAAVWPFVGGSHDRDLSLYLSTDGGARFSSAVPIARVGPADADFDNARVAVAPNGTGIVTFEDGNGLEVANLQPLAKTYARLEVHHDVTVRVPVTCEAPKGSCTATASITHRGTTIATGDRRVPSGQTVLLDVPLNAAGQALLTAAHGHRLKARLHLTVTQPGAQTLSLDDHTVIVG